MTTYTVRKDGSGTHTTIQSAIYQAVNGDIIDVGAGTFNENVELTSKNLTLQGAGKDVTIIQGKLANDTVTGCSFYGGETIITTTSTSPLIVGKGISLSSYITTGSKVDAVLSATTFRSSLPTATTGNITKTGVTWSSGSSTITLPSTTAVVVGMKVESTLVSGVNAIVTAYNSTTRVVTLNTPTTGAGSASTLLFRKYNSGLTITQASNVGSGFGSIMLTGVTDGIVIKNLTAIGFDGTVGQEAAAFFITSTASPGHTNLLMENCRLTASGDSAIMCSSNPYFSNSTFQNCIIDGKTFVGSEPADVPSFSTYVANGVVKSIGASSSVITFSDMRGIIVGRTFTCASAFSGSATISAISGNDATFNKIATFNVGDTLACTFTLTAYTVPNCARNLVQIGQNVSPCNTSNITFKNNTVNGETGAVISATGSVKMFNSAVTIESVGGLVENNVIDGTFGAGPNSLLSNFAIRCRQAGIIVQNNTVNFIGGKENSGFYISLGTSTNNLILRGLIAQLSQAISGENVSIVMDKNQIHAISKVYSDATFSNEANWHLVTFIFKHKTSARRLTSSFKVFDETRQIKLRSGMAPSDEFELVKVILSDPQRVLFVLKRNEILNASSSDFTLL
jgi:hypothetical protein